MKRIAVFPGSFDPITKGHENVVRRAAHMFDEVVVAIGHNTTKQTMFSLEQRQIWISETFKDLSNVRTSLYDGLTVEFCKREKARFLLRGLRNSGDFEYERTIAHMNKALWSDLETVLMFTDTSYVSVHSTVIREIIKNNGDVSQFVPAAVRF